VAEPVTSSTPVEREDSAPPRVQLKPKAATPTRIPGYAPVTVTPGAPELPSIVIEPAPTVLALEPLGPSGPGGSGGDTDFEHREPPPGPWVPPGAAINRSRYMDYLPGIYSRNDFMARYLLIFESILGPVERTVDNIPHLFDPALAPSDVLPWLGSWLGLALDERWPDARRRELIKSAAELYHWRGTRRGLSEFIRLYTGIVPEIIEPTLSQISSSRDLAFRFTVRLTVPADLEVDRVLLEQIIDAEKPAFAAGSLEIVRA
jgi:phage tail-like protein